MKELSKVRQIPGESKRRWFASQDFDLIVWLSDDQSFSGFELCYGKLRNERSIVWSKTGGFRHMAVDDSEHRPGKYKASPIFGGGRRFRRPAHPCGLSRRQPFLTARRCRLCAAGT
ncbi:MAG: hypothetical protein K8F27_07425 [Sulfuricellaceae bacterium]|nr:hypothetical protein [Sulfuricellaceae bacterium]